MAWVVGMSVLIVIACSSGGDESLTPSASEVTVVPTMASDSNNATAQAPVTTVTPVPTTALPLPTPLNGATAISKLVPTSTAVPESLRPPEPSVDLATLTVPVCNTRSSSSSTDGFGTVPHATATPLPQSGGSVQPSSDEATAFVAGVRPLYNALISVIEAGNASWASAESDQGRGASISYEGRRLSHICAALSAIPRNTENSVLFSELAVGLESRRAALFEAAESQRADGMGIPNEVERARTSSVLLSFGSTLEEFATSRGIDDSAGADGYAILNPLLAITANVGPGWVTVRNGIDVFITAPPDVQRFSVSGLGPDAWKLGTSLRIRRFRNETESTLDEAAVLLDSLLIRFGSRTEKFDSTIGTNPGVRLVYTNDDGYWRTLVGATVVGDATYLFELGCPVEFTEECESGLSAILSGVTFNTG